MNSYKIKKEKKFPAKSKKNKKKALVYKTFKSKVEGVEGAMFQRRAVKHAANFTKLLEETVKYV